MEITAQAEIFASVAMETFALLVTALLLLSSLLARQKHDRRSRLFNAMLTVNAFALVCDLITWLVEGPRYTSLIYAANFFVFALGYGMTALFTRYLASYIAQPQKTDRWLFRGIDILSGVSVLSVGVSLFNGMYFYVENGRLHAGDMGWLSVALTFVMILADMMLILLHRRELGVQNTIAFLSYGVFPVVAFVVQMIGTELTVTWLASTLTMLLIYLMVHVEYVRQLEHRKAELAENRRELSESRTALMISQIQPHFLYNSLTVIDQLIRTDPQLARRALADFSTYLRCNLSSLNHNGRIPFSDELRHIRAYLDLEEMRFGEYLTVEYEIETENFDVPALSVQPLVENAVKHGLSDKEDGGTVTIAAREYDDRYEVTVQDDGEGFVPGEKKGDGAHIGIENIRARLAAMCGGTLVIQSEKGRGTTATVIIGKDAAGGETI